MNFVRHAFLIICLLAFTGQSLAGVIPADCGDHEGSTTPPETMDHSQHHGMLDEVDKDSQASDCCELDCGDCILHHSPNLLITVDTPSHADDIPTPKYSLTSDALFSKHPTSLYKPPITR